MSSAELNPRRDEGASSDQEVGVPPYYLEESGLLVLKKWIDVLKGSSKQGNTRGIFYDHALRVKKCNPEGEWLYYRCPDGHFSTWRPFKPCHDHYCPVCSGRYAKSKGVDAFRRLRAFNASVGHFVFTIPDKYWELFFDKEMLARLYRIVREVLKEFYGGMVGGLNRPHTWGDKKPEWVGKIKPHAHVLIPLLMVKDGEFVKLPVYLKEKDFVKLRALYRKAFNKEFGFDVPEINVNYSYKRKDQPEKLMNCCMYVMRPPLELPLRKSMKKVMLFGKKRLMKVLKHFEFYEGYRSLRWFGFMARNVIRKYLKLREFLTDQAIDEVLSPFNGKNCPICGKRLEYRAYYKNHKLVLVDKDPPPLKDARSIK